MSEISIYNGVSSARSLGFAGFRWLHENPVEQPHHPHFTREYSVAQWPAQHCLLRVHGGFRFKLRFVWISNWCYVRIRLPMNLSTWDRSGGVRRRNPMLLVHPILPVFFPPLHSPSTSSSTTPIPLHLLGIKLRKQNWNGCCSANPSLETPTYTSLMLLMMFYRFPL